MIKIALMSFRQNEVTRNASEISHISIRPKNEVLQLFRTEKYTITLTIVEVILLKIKPIMSSAMVSRMRVTTKGTTNNFKKLSKLAAMTNEKHSCSKYP